MINEELEKITYEESEKTTYEAKRNNRFVVDFQGLFNIQNWSVTKINKPKFTNGEWENIRIDFIDPIAPSTSQCLFKIVNFLKTNLNDSEILFNIKIKSLDSTGAEVEEWIIDIEEVLSVNFGDLNYGDDNRQQPYLVLKPLNCNLTY
jgi:hypothetical protein